MRKNRKTGYTGFSVSSVIAGICLMLFIFSISVVLVLNAGWIYDVDVVLLGLDKQSGLSINDIKANYNALIEYNRVWNQGALVLPTLPMSQNAAIHFKEVKRIFDALQILCGVTGIISLIMVFVMGRRGDKRWLKTAGVLTLVTPAVLGALCALNWQKFFITFHHLFFRNDYWLFDPATDPIILILPDTYFLHCAVGILALIFLGGMICLLVGRRKKRSARR